MLSADFLLIAAAGWGRLFPQGGGIGPLVSPHPVSSKSTSTLGFSVDTARDWDESDQVFDEAQFGYLRSLPRFDVSRLVALYRQHANELLEKLYLALQRHDTDDIHHLAHALKGTSSTLGGLSVARLCAHIQYEPPPTDPRELRLLIDRLRTEHARFLDALARHL